MKRSRGYHVTLLLALVAWTGCVSTGASDVRADSGPGRESSGPIATAGLPTPAGAGNLPQPSGTPGNLRVLDWAGFKSAVSYTIDDGQPSQIEHYADLQATGVRMTFNLNSSATWATGFTSTFTQAVADGHEIGNHTVHHCHAEADGTLYNLDSSNQRTACAGPTMAAEFDACTTFITGALGASNVWTSASPFGDTGYKTAASQRFFLNRGVMSGTVAPNDNTDPFDLPVWPATENDTVDRFNAALDGARTRSHWVIILLHSIAPTTARWYATVDISAITGSIRHAQSLGDIWIDTMANVGAYWRGQALLSSATPTTSGTTQTWTWTLPPHFPTGKYLRVTVDGGRLAQNGRPLDWNAHGYYEVALDVGSMTLAP